MAMIGREPARAAMTAGDIGDNTIGSNKIIDASIVSADIGATEHRNLATLPENITAPALYSTAIIGPVTIPNLTVDGNLTVMTELNVTGNTTIAATGQLNIIG